ncbi:DNA repair protein RadA isoform X2 [Telopea speciosissima]|uniref:DNA repair protein RadA isoform X2 n=1 Tax=Telopea speciosissima TaxID=54955 RepID=UPI001CC52FA1|nr:DNA repair protein RadA isoform X2 [Telopea speciosissima]
MQSRNMGALRTVYSNRMILSFTKTRFNSTSALLLHPFTLKWRFPWNLRYMVQRTIQSSTLRHDEDFKHGSNLNSSDGDELGSSCRDEKRGVWSIYDPVADKVLTTRSVGDTRSREEESCSEDESPMTLSSFDSAGGISPEKPVNRPKNVEDQSVSGDGTPKRCSGYHSRGEESALKRSSSVVKNLDKETNRVSSGSSVSGRGTILKKKKGKSKIQWVCSDCGESFYQWWGICPSCMGKLVQFSQSETIEDKPRGFEVTENAVRSWLPHKTGDMNPQRLTDVRKGLNQSQWRIPLSGLFGTEVARVLGGGLVPGSLVLFGGDPGVGKSTLLLQIAADLAEGGGFGRPGCVVYVSGEESVEQIGSRADRMLIGTEELFLYSGTDVEDILEKILPLEPRALIVDSIQTVYLQGVTGNAGGLSQVKDCTSLLLRFAKRTNVPVLLIGHVTKTGDIAGPRVLEHIVDVVLYMEGEKHSSHRLLRSVKNRYGSTDELGVFEMTQSGLQAVSNPSEIFLSEQHFNSEVLAGLAVAVIVDGSRTFLIEVQALCLSSSSAARHVNGLESSRADMIIAVLTKQAGLKLQDNAIFLNVVSGVRLTETAGDVAIALAVCSSFLECPIPNDIAFIGEVGLGGELRAVPRMEKRVISVAKLGYKKCVVPKSTEKLLAALELEGMIVLGCSNLKEVINTVFQPEPLEAIQAQLPFSLSSEL